MRTVLTGSYSSLVVPPSYNISNFTPDHSELALRLYSILDLMEYRLPRPTVTNISLSKTKPFRSLLLVAVLLSAPAATSADDTAPHDDQSAIKSRIEAAGRVDVEAMRNLGLAHEQGRGVVQDYAVARQWYERAAAAGDAAALTLIGLLHANGRGVPQDYARARVWYEKAVVAGESEAMRLLGVLYKNGSGVVQSYGKARQWFENAAWSGNAHAMGHLSVLYEDGLGVPKDLEKAFRWRLSAAERGDENAMYMVASDFEKGHGVPTNYAKAFEWYTKAAEKGDSSAMFSLGMMYEDGVGMQNDLEKAREHYLKSATAGEASAMTRVGLFHFYGEGGVPKDFSKAKEWFDKAAEKNDAEAKRYLAMIFSNENGVDKNLSKARKLLEEAAGQGYWLAKRDLLRFDIKQAVNAGRHDEALSLQERLAFEVEEDEKKENSGKVKRTAQELGSGLAWFALVARQPAKALAATERALSLVPGDLVTETNRAHALMLLGRATEARAIYSAHTGKNMPENDNKLWQDVISNDFKELQKSGVEHQQMHEIRQLLGFK
ncbi:MAG: hypothetical protein ABL901_12715 [Hyphomicrobiaceae bacterium]